MTKEEKEEIIKIVKKTTKLIPATLDHNLPPPTLFPDVPQWQDYEYKIWDNGEQFR